MKYLVDSNIIIYHLNGESTASNFLKQNHNNIAISIVTYLEVLSFNFDDDTQQDIEKLLESFAIINFTINVAKQAVKNRKITNIKVPDNIIASTAQIHNLILVTRNVKDFKSLNMEILNIFN